MFVLFANLWDCSLSTARAPVKTIMPAEWHSIRLRLPALNQFIQNLAQQAFVTASCLEAPGHQRHERQRTYHEIALCHQHHRRFPPGSPYCAAVVRQIGRCNKPQPASRIFQFAMGIPAEARSHQCCRRVGARQAGRWPRLCRDPRWWFPGRKAGSKRQSNCDRGCPSMVQARQR